MKKRILSMMLVLCMVLGMMPTAFAEDDASGSVDVTTFADLKTALEAAAAADSGDTTINILRQHRTNAKIHIVGKPFSKKQ